MTVTREGENVVVDASIRRPSIYLDHWAIRHLSSDPSNCERFVACFKRKGTLLFSWANALEIASNTGASADNIRRFLSEIGDQWFPLDINPIKVIEREYSSGRDNPCFAAGFLEAYYPHIHAGPFSLSRIVDLIHDDEIKAAAERNIELLKTEIPRQFDRLRAAKPPLKNSSFDPSRPTEFVYNGLLQLIIKESFKIEANDALDFCHATVSLAYGDMVLLDKHWTDLAQKLKMPPDRVRIYSQKQIDQFLQDLRSA